MLGNEREALAILAAAGNTKEYLGKELSLGDVHKLSRKEVASLHLRYQVTLGKQVEHSLSSGVLKVACKAVRACVGSSREKTGFRAGTVNRPPAGCSDPT